jgi:hypothetical protein
MLARMQLTSAWSMRSLWAVALLLLAAAPPAIADDYRAEARAWAALARNDGPDGKSYGLRGAYYFGDVSTDGVPLGEAAFLGRESRMSLQASRAGAGGDYHGYQYLDTEIYIPSSVPLYVAAGIARFETFDYDPNTFEPRRGHDTGWDAAVGITPLDGLRIATRFFEDAGYDPNLDARYVGAVGNGRWFGVGVNLYKPDNYKLTWGVAADYFPDRTLRLGVMYEDASDTTWLVAEKFFASRVSVMFAYVDSLYGDGFRAEAAWRF